MEISFSNVQQAIVFLGDIESLSAELHVTRRDGYNKDEGYWYEYRIVEDGFIPVVFTIDGNSYSYGEITADDEFEFISKKNFFKRLNKMLESVTYQVRFVKGDEKVYKLEMSDVQ